MPKILEWSFKNACSYGNKLQKIELVDGASLVLIAGENGAGKTTIGNVLEFAIYGKTRRRRIGSFANRHNGHLETFVHYLTDDGRDVKCARGIDPSYVELNVDDKPDNKAGKTKIDQYIEDELYEIPFEVCTNTMILSINDFKSFVKIRAEDKRKIVDKIFGFETINKMRAMLVEDVRIIREDMSKLDALRCQHADLIAHTEGQLVEMRKNIVFEIENKCSELATRVSEIMATISEHDATASECDAEELRLSGQRAGELVTIESDIRAAAAEAAAKIAEISEKLESELNSKISGAQAKLQAVLSARNATFDAEYKTRDENINNAACEAERVRDASFAKAGADRDAARQLAIEENDAEIKRISAEETSLVSKISASRDDEKRAVISEKESHASDIANLTADVVKQKENIAVTKHALAELNRKIELYERGVCPECETDLKSGEHVKKHAGIIAMTKEANDALVSCDARIRALVDEISAKETLIKECDKRMRDIDETIAGEISDAITAAKQLRSDASDRFNLAINSIGDAYNRQHEIAVSEYNKAMSALYEMKADLLRMRAEKEQHDAADTAATESEISVMKDSAANAKAVEIKEANEKLDEKNKELYARRESVINQYASGISAARQGAATARAVADGLRREADEKRSEIDRMRAAAADNAGAKSMEAMLDELRERHAAVVANLADSESSLKTAQAVQEVLSEDGIKKSFMRKVLPVLNGTIRAISNTLQFKFDFDFDENFDVSIRHMGHEIGVESLSTGEEKMIDIIVVLAVMELIKMKHPKMNVMFIDELFASLDPYNTERIVGILRGFVEKYGMTIFAISHTNMPKHFFDKTISVVNDGIFSDMSIA